LMRSKKCRTCGFRTATLSFEEGFEMSIEV
jgi:hypothetical protein